MPGVARIDRPMIYIKPIAEVLQRRDSGLAFLHRSAFMPSPSTTLQETNMYADKLDTLWQETGRYRP